MDEARHIKVAGGHGIGSISFGVTTITCTIPTSWTAWRGRRSPATRWRRGLARRGRRVLTAHGPRGRVGPVVVGRGSMMATWPGVRNRASGAVQVRSSWTRPRDRDLRRARRDGRATGTEMSSGLEIGPGCRRRRSCALASTALDEERGSSRRDHLARRALIVTASAEPTARTGRPVLAELAGDDVEPEQVGGADGAGCPLPRSRGPAHAPRPTRASGPVRRAAEAQLARLAAAGVRGAQAPRAQWYALTRSGRAGTMVEVRPVAISQVEDVHQVRAALAARVRGWVSSPQRAPPLRDRDHTPRRPWPRRRRRCGQHQRSPRLASSRFGSAGYSAKQRGRERMVQQVPRWNNRANPRPAWPSSRSCGSGRAGAG